MNAEDNEILRRSLVFCFLSDEHFETIEPLLPPWVAARNAKQTRGG